MVRNAAIEKTLYPDAVEGLRKEWGKSPKKVVNSYKLSSVVRAINGSSKSSIAVPTVASSMLNKLIAICDERAAVNGGQSFAGLLSTGF